MAEEESAEQVRDRHIRDMGPELGPVYHVLCGEVAWLHAKWNQYRQLYAHSPERVALLNRVAGHFIGVVQGALYDDVLLHLVRLTDRRKDTLALQRLPKLAPDSALASELQWLVQAASDACDSAKSSRDKRIAHMDLALALAGSFDDAPSRAQLETALRAVRAVLHRLEVHYWQSKTAYERFIPAGRDGYSLVYYLLKGLRAEERQIQRLCRGEPLPDDLAPEDHTEQPVAEQAQRGHWVLS